MPQKIKHISHLLRVLNRDLHVKQPHLVQRVERVGQRAVYIKALELWTEARDDLRDLVLTQYRIYGLLHINNVTRALVVGVRVCGEQPVGDIALEIFSWSSAGIDW